MRKKRKFYDKLLANIEESGFTVPTPIQRQVLPQLLHRREVLAVAPTGDPCDDYILPWPIASNGKYAPCMGSLKFPSSIAQ